MTVGAALRVVHLNTESTWRGGERQTLWLARALSRRGHACWVAARPGAPLAGAAAAAGLPVVSTRPWGEFDLWSARGLSRFLTRNAVDVLHAHTAHAVGLGALAILGTDTRFLATRRVDFPLRAHLFSRWKYGRLDGVVAISGKVREMLLRGGVPDGRVAVIPSGVDPEGYPSTASRESLRRAKGFPAEDRLVVQTAALTPHKDQATLIKAAKTVCAAEPRARVLILGEGALRGDLERLVGALGLRGRVLLPGHRSDALEHIALSDVFVMSSSEEGLGSSLLDAMAVGVPTVATRAGGIPDLYGGPDAPELVPVRDPDALAAAILRVLRDPAEAARRVQRGRAIAADFSVRRMTDRYEEVYRTLMTREEDR